MMSQFDVSGRQAWRVLAAVGLAALAWLLLPDSSRPFLSHWRGDVASAANDSGLSGQAVAVEQAPADPQSYFAQAPDNPDRPWGDPLGGGGRTVMTQGYGVGTHAPKEVWGAVDLAIDGDGDGTPEPASTQGVPVYATHAGVVKLSPNSYPAGNHVWVVGQRYKTGYAHLLNFAVSDGQAVQRGTLIGFVGSSGMSSGPHLDYQVWEDGVNVDPLGFNIFP